MAELKAVVAKWPHERDRGWFRRNENEPWTLIWDSGCDRFCRRCAVERWIAKWESRLREEVA